MIGKNRGMRNTGLIVVLAALLLSCDQSRDTRGIPGPEEVKAKAPDSIMDLENEADKLRKKGHASFIYEGEDGKHLMQQYYIVFLKRGKNRNQDSIEASRLQEEHLAHLNRMAKEGYLSLAGPFGDDDSIRGIAIYHTPTLAMADSLARLDPMVKAGRLSVEIHPWWAEKGGTLK